MWLSATYTDYMLGLCILQPNCVNLYQIYPAETDKQFSEEEAHAVLQH
jgi:hypothetical protein